MTATAVEIDLRSDTVTKPTESMKKAMVSAQLGDDVFGEDPTVKALENKVAGMLGKEAALFVPSGTMANLLAILVHCNKRGAEVICGNLSHIARSEQGGASHLGGVFMTVIQNNADGTFDLTKLEHTIRGSDIHEPITMMVAVENTHNVVGGRVVPPEWLDKVSAIVKKHGLVLHMDGARLFNAAEYLKVEPSHIVRDCDSVSVCFSKGLGAPVGSALVGSRSFIDQARRLRKMLGGGMRQAGVLAAAAIVALDESIPNLYADHNRARFLNKSMADMKLSSFHVTLEIQHTNIVNITIKDHSSITSDQVVNRFSIICQAELNGNCKTSNGRGISVKAGATHPKIVRLVLHYDINDDDLRLAVKKVCFVLKEMDGS